MFEVLIRYVFSWLPTPIWLCVWAVLAVFFFVLVVKLVSFILDVVLKFVGLFI